MKEIIYNKLVRDRIPDIIKSSGKDCICRELNDAEYVDALKAKIFEEAEEVKAAADDESLMEEMADIVEILAAMAFHKGKNLGDIIKIAGDKRSKRGGFDKKIFLEKVVEK